MTWHLAPASKFGELAAEWDDLQRRTTNTPFLESLFLVPLLEIFGSGREVIAMHRVGGRADTAAIVAPVGRGMWSTFQPSQLPLGPWLCTASDDLSARMQGLLRVLPGWPLGLGATQLDPRLAGRPVEADNLRTLDYVRTSFIDVDGPFEAYWDARGKNLRQNMRKQRNKLQAEGTTTTFECLTAPEQVAKAIRDYGALESSGWKADTGTAIHPNNDQGRFYTQVLQSFCAQGRARIIRYCFAGKAVSMDLCIDNGPLVVILKTAYDESVRSVSPSTLMRQEEFEAWWNEGRYRRIEFYGKTMEWHTRWTDRERLLFHATAYRWPLLRSLHERLRALRAMPVDAAPDLSDRGLPSVSPDTTRTLS